MKFWRIGSFLILVTAMIGCTERINYFSLQVLATEATQIDGQLVATEGVVRVHEDPRHYWIEDSALNRVAIVPEQAVMDFVGEHVQVEGRFYADRERGRRIEANLVRRIDSE